MIEWNSDGDVSVDGKWVIQTERLRGEPIWREFMKVPSEVRQYADDHPGDTDAWLGQYSASQRDMHAQAERLLKIVAKAKRSRK